MLKNFNDSESYIRLIKSEERSFEELSIGYRFYEIGVTGMRVQYAMGIITDDDECFACLGDDREAAASLANDIIFGGVTPCTLHDIVSDRQKEEYYLY